MNNEPKPCPFCGWDNLKITIKRGGTYRRTSDLVQVLCNKCKARGPVFTAKQDEVIGAQGYVLYTERNPLAVAHAKQLAIDAWNRREYR